MAVSSLIDARLSGEINMADAELIVYKNASIPGSALQQTANVKRTQLETDADQPYPVPLTLMRVHDAVQTNLPGTAAADDLALIGGTLGTAAPTLQTSDAKATTVTQYARFQVALPPEYVAAGTVTLRVRGGMVTTISDGTATVDAEVYAQDRDGAVGSDICATSATTINSLTKADVEFEITPTTLEAGNVLDIRLAVAITDTATGTAVIGEISEVALLLDVKG